MSRCGWRPCEAEQVGLSTYCADHREQARRNVLTALGLHAPTSLIWRPGDEEWLMTEAGVTDPRERVLVRGRLGGTR